MRNGPAPEPSRRPLLTIGAVFVAASVAAALAAAVRGRPAREPNDGAAPALKTAAAILSASVLFDSAIEHYRGSFRNRAMFVAPTVAAVTLAAALANSRQAPARVGFGLALATGAMGLGFHSYDILRRTGGVSMRNLFYAAPVGAPAALSLAGAFGLASGALRNGSTSVGGVPLKLVAGGLAIATLAGSAAEAGLLHFRGAYHDPFMYAPVTVPPLAAAALGAALVDSRAAAVARPLLGATAVLGIAGPMFHAYGIHRNMGGWRNWSQNLLAGPPLPAPPAFLAGAIAGRGMLPLLAQVRR